LLFHASLLSITIEAKLFNVYHTEYPVSPNPNLVVLESSIDPEDLYFRAFLGKPLAECKTENELDLFFEKLENSVSPEFRVAGKDLEKRIIEVLDKVDMGNFPKQG